ncbi:MAG: DNA polymerase III subunit delta [Rhizobiaceae bacterium]
MAVLSSRNIEPFLAKPDFSHSVYLLFGPDTGLVNERANLLAEKSGVDLADPFSLLKLSADEAAADPGRLSDEASTIGMFGGKRLIRVSGKTQRDLLKSIKPLLDTPPEDAIVIVEAGDLKKTVALRKNLEAHKNSLCIPCYQDNAAALETLIDQEIVGVGLDIDRGTRSELRALLGDNRQLSRNELKKLALYCTGKTVVTVEDVRAIVGDGASLVLNDLIDAVAIGNAARLQSIFPKAVEAGNNPDMILMATLRHFQLLQLMEAKMQSGNLSASSVISGARPPIHFSRKDAVLSALSIWKTERIVKAMTRIQTMILECRKNSPASASIAGTALLAIALEAQALGRR